MKRIPILASAVFIFILGAALFASQAAPVALGEEADETAVSKIQETAEVSVSDPVVSDSDEIKKPAVQNPPAVQNSPAVQNPPAVQDRESPAGILDLFLSHVSDPVRTAVLQKIQAQTALQSLEQRLQTLNNQQLELSN